ncbi:MAG: TIGR02646 family protein [Paludibacteraceae bacterium]|jgi:uncharacterized protein (TIGR02646 family)|nr:TIGR02646 family protein [Paludibacteraceae bacterium]
MRHITKSACPIELQTYLQENPDATWEQFKREHASKIVKETIINDQEGICCYCEVDFLDPPDIHHMPDFRVEHFFPKERNKLLNGENAHLTWSNLLGACHGGSQKAFNKTKRYTSPDLHCDAIKGKEEWTTTILNPLNIPAGIEIFSFKSTDGEMMVSKNCPPELAQLAGNSIQLLNLNQETYLKDARRVIIEVLEQQIVEESETKTFEEAIEYLRQVHLYAAEKKNFFTCKSYVLNG